MKSKEILLLMVLLLNLAGHLKTQTKTMSDTGDKRFSCDIETGVCAPNDHAEIEEINLVQHEKIKLIYYTDPICSACWAIEPQLKKFKLEYGDYVEVEYKMGGLLPGWEGFADKANGISKPSDVAQHWDEVGQHSGMSIDGDLWLEDPLDSSFPPSIAFKAAQKQGRAFSLRFLRRIREQLFLEKKNITKEECLREAVADCGGDVSQFIADYRHETTTQSFHLEMQQGRAMGVRGFPTFIFMGKDGKGFKISGMSAYKYYVMALEKAFGKKLSPSPIYLSEIQLLEKYRYLATKEISFVLSQDDNITLAHLNELVTENKVVREKQKFGDFWRIVPIVH